MPAPTPQEWPLLRGWPSPIPVSERLPEVVDKLEQWSNWVIGFCEECKSWHEMFYKHSEGIWCCRTCADTDEPLPTHWLPLPPPIKD
jgi:hypothetical protein